MSGNSTLEQIRAKWCYLKNHIGFQQSPVAVLGRLLLWRVQCLFGMSAVISLPRWNARFFLPAKWRGATKLTFAFRENYERELRFLNRLVLPGSLVLDVGASYGIYTVAASKLVGNSGRVLSFEPGTVSFSILLRNVELNHLQNVQVFRTALSDRAERARLYHHPHGPSSYTLGTDTSLTEFEEITTTTIDIILAQESINKVDFLKMDIEGAEELVLRGATSLLGRARPTVVYEVNPGACARLGLTRDGTWNLLKGLGYRFFRMGNKGELVELVFPPTGGNVVAIHKRNE